MKLNPRIYLGAVIAFAIVVGFLLTAPDSMFEKPKRLAKINYHWNKLQQSKKITALTHNNSTGYFIYKGQPMGFQYDLLKAFCKEYDYELDIVVEDNMNKAIRKIRHGKADILAVDLTLTKSRKRFLNLSHPIGFNHQVLVQRVENKAQISDFMEAVLDLEGKEVHVQKGTIFVEQLKYLQEQTGTNFSIIEHKDNTMEDLIIMVAEGEIDYTACDERPALSIATYYPNIDLSLKLSAKQKLCWAIPPHEDSLMLQLNSWLDNYTQSKKFKSTERKYYSKRKFKFKTDQAYLPAKGGQLTPYDELIKKYAATIQWDWRLLASLIYQESRFNPETESWVGAIGLMQIMPETGKRMGVDDISDVEGNLKAGTKFIQWLDKQLIEAVPDSAERLYFVLGAYNCGLGHIQDAQTLAEKNDKDPKKWLQNTDTFILLKSQAKYYHDPDVKYGYCRGKQTYDFVREIMDRYKDYRNLVSE
jgi:membrane-bound lytic murein transglycosylase F